MEGATAAEDSIGMVPADICVVDNVAEAKRIVTLLCTKYRDFFFACDTEVSVCCEGERRRLYSMLYLFNLVQCEHVLVLHFASNCKHGRCILLI